jgi:CRISPR/Cas system-associated protein Csx1
MSHNEERIKLKDYDHILVVSSWGSPEEYEETKYALELKVVKNSKTRRETKSPSDKDYHCCHSSTASIKDWLKKLNINEDKLTLLIFVQDTILLNHIKSNEGEYFGKEGKNYKRGELKDKLLLRLYDQKQKAAWELNVKKKEDYDKIVRFVPGVITSKEGAYLYTWRYERSYDLLLAGIILFTYEKLKEIRKHKNFKSLAILMDTTHGINYFVAALKEGILKATTLYVLDDLAEKGFDSYNFSRLEEIIVYHYNSDPLSPKSKGVPSLKLHLLGETAIVRDGSPIFNSLFSIVEEHVSREGLEGLSDQLNMWWGRIDWKKVVEALLLFSRGLLVWALRAILDIPSLPSIEELIEAFNNIELKFSKNNDKNYSIDYKPEVSRNPLAHVVEYSLMASSLKKLVEKSSCTSDIYSEGFEFIEKVSQELKSELEKVGLHEVLQNIIKHKNEYKCFRLEKIQQITELIYTSPYFDIVENEIKNIDEYLRRDIKNIEWIQLNNHIYKERRSKPAYIIDYSYSRLLISKADRVSVEKRVIYAHAGLAYGLPWFAFKLKENSNIIFLGSPDKVVHILRAAAYAK